MVDIVLLAGKLLFIALLFLFLFAVARTGLGLVSGAAPRDSTWRLGLVVDRGPKELRGIKLDLSEPITIGRASDSSLVIADEFVSSRHATVDPTERGPVLTDLGSTNGTVLNGKRLKHATVLSPGDVVDLGNVHLKVQKL